ncbi:MAG: tetratricopeptide repeat protein [Solirubrobacteraceae bacterium]|nr:tetratricopeptide repeat protein [Solirubrobacteraceae bacterium]
MFRKSAARTARILNVTRSRVRPGVYLELARDAAGKYPSDDKVLFHLVLALTENKEWEEAADVAGRAAELSVDPEILIVAAWSFITVGRGEDARAAVAKVLDGQPLEPYVRTEAVFLRGAANSILGEMELAEPDLRAAVARNDQSPTYIWHLAKFLVVNDRRDEALELVTIARRVADEADRAEALGELAEMGLVP